MNTPHNKNRIREEGWKNVWKNMLPFCNQSPPVNNSQESNTRSTLRNTTNGKCNDVGSSNADNTRTVGQQQDIEPDPERNETSDARPKNRNRNVVTKRNSLHNEIDRRNQAYTHIKVNKRNFRRDFRKRLPQQNGKTASVNKFRDTSNHKDAYELFIISRSRSLKSGDINTNDVFPNVPIK